MLHKTRSFTAKSSRCVSPRGHVAVVFMGMDVHLGISIVVSHPLRTLSLFPLAGREEGGGELKRQDMYSGKKFVLQMSSSSKAKVK